MLSEATAGESQQQSNGAAFRRRLAENFFRRFWWYLLPIVAMTAIGVVQANSTVDLYRSTGTLSASRNPLVDESPNSAATASFFESSAGATSRIINERMQTDTFSTAVAERAGLGDALESGFFDLAVVRSSVFAFAEGNAILSVAATWADPETSYQLATATIAEYQDFLAETIASDSAAAVDFYEERLVEQMDDRAAALDELITYVAGLPALGGGEVRPPDQEINIELRRDQIKAVDAEIAATRQNIDDARLAVAQQTAAAGQSISVIDPPTVPRAHDSSFMQRLSLILSFFLLGVVIAGAALLLATVLDSSITSPADLLALDGVSLVATAPLVAIGRTGSDLSRRRRGRRGIGGRRRIGPAGGATT